MWPDRAIFKQLGDEFSYKSNPNIWQLVGPILPKICHFSIKSTEATIWATWGQNWAILIPTSCHTGYEYVSVGTLKVVVGCRLRPFHNR